MPAGLLAVGCGGSVDLDSPKAVAGSAANLGGAGTTPRGGASATASGGSGADGGVHDVGGSANQAGIANGTGGASGSAATNQGVSAWLAYDAQPDNEQRGIYLMNAAQGAGCSDRVTPSDVTAKQPSFSDDGKLLAYAAEEEPGRYQIHVLDLTTGDGRQVTHLSQGASYPAFAPSGFGLAFVTGDPEALRDGLVDEAAGAGDLMQVDLKTLETTLIRPMESDDPFPYFSPAYSGNRIFFSNSYKMLGAFFSGSEVTIKEFPFGALAQDPAPSPDGRSLAYVDSCSDWLDLFIVDLALGSTRDCVAPSRELSHEQGYVSPDWGQFGLVAVELDNPRRGLYLLDEMDGASRGGLAVAKLARNPDWAPNTFTRACR